jgi:hypothetical protein
MTDGQTRVLVLLLVLAAMEMALQPAIKSALQGAWNQFQTGLNAGSTPKK